MNIHSSQTFMRPPIFQLTDRQIAQHHIDIRISQLIFYFPQSIEGITEKGEKVRFHATQIAWPSFSDLELMKTYLSNVYWIIKQLSSKEYILSAHPRGLGGGQSQSTQIFISSKYFNKGYKMLLTDNATKPLGYAIWAQDPIKVEELLKKGANPNTHIKYVMPYGSSKELAFPPLLLALLMAKHLEDTKDKDQLLQRVMQVIELLIQYGANINEILINEKEGRPIACVAMQFIPKAHNGELLLYMLKNGLDPNTTFPNEYDFFKENSNATLFSFAIVHSRKECAILLLEKGYNTHTKSKNNSQEEMRSLLLKGWYDVFDLMVEKDSSPEFTKSLNENIKWFGKRFGECWNRNEEQLKILKLLLKNKADPNQGLILYYATKNEDKKTIQLLKEHGANVNIAFSHALQFYSEKEGETTCKKWIEIGADPNLFLLQEIREGNIEKINLLIKLGAQIDKVKSDPQYIADVNAAFSRALQHFDRETKCEIWVKLGADPNLFLLQEIRQGYGVIINLLLKLGAQTHKAFFQALEEKDNVSCNKLLQLGAEPNKLLLQAAQAQNDPQYIAAINAAFSGALQNYNVEKTCEMWIKLGANPTLFLLPEIREGDPLKINLLIELGAQIDKAFFQALNEEDNTSCNKLLKLGADPNKLLLQAAKAQNVSYCSNLVKLNVNLNVVLFQAAKEENKQACHLLLRYNAVLNDAFLLALKEKDEKACLFLVKLGANPNEILEKSTHENEKIISFLIKVGADFRLSSDEIKLQFSYLIQKQYLGEKELQRLLVEPLFVRIFGSIRQDILDKLENVHELQNLKKAIAKIIISLDVIPLLKSDNQQVILNRNLFFDKIIEKMNQTLSNRIYFDYEKKTINLQDLIEVLKDTIVSWKTLIQHQAENIQRQKEIKVNAEKQVELQKELLIKQHQQSAELQRVETKYKELLKKQEIELEQQKLESERQKQGYEKALKIQEEKFVSELKEQQSYAQRQLNNLTKETEKKLEELQYEVDILEIQANDPYHY